MVWTSISRRSVAVLVLETIHDVEDCMKSRYTVVVKQAGRNTPNGACLVERLHELDDHGMLEPAFWGRHGVSGVEIKFLGKLYTLDLQVFWLMTLFSAPNYCGEFS